MSNCPFYNEQTLSNTGLKNPLSLIQGGKKSKKV